MVLLDRAKVTIRRYKASDKKGVITLHRLALEQTGAFIKSGKWDEDLQNIEENYLKDGEFLIIEVGGKLVAMGALRRISEDTFELKRMRVDPRYQGKGLGQKMLTLLENRARELRCKKIILDTTEKQKAAQSLYLKNGYKETKREMIDSIKMQFIYFEKVLQ